MIWTILALACIVLGFVGKIIDERILLGTLEWFVATIAFNTLGWQPLVVATTFGLLEPRRAPSGPYRLVTHADGS
jgi:hypothetical protein